MFINQTKNDLENNLAVSRITGRKVRGLLCVFGVVLVALGVLWIVLFPEDVSFAIFCWGCGAAAILFSFVLFSWLVKRSIQKQMHDKEADVTYTFEEDGFFIDGRTVTGMTEHAEGRYTDFTSIVEYDEFWLLYYNKFAMYILRKDGMKEGTAEDFSVFLGVKGGSVYKDMRRKKQRKK